jgi:ABC-type bacteriocin/lantibiotic exporter with double-glycine peptidase domain
MVLIALVFVFIVLVLILVIVIVIVLVIAFIFVIAGLGFLSLVGDDSTELVERSRRHQSYERVLLKWKGFKFGQG